MVGRAAVEAYPGRMMAQLAPKFSLTREETIESGRLIVQRGRYTVSLKQGDGGLTEDAGKYVIVWQESYEGGWEILWDIDNSDSPAT